MNLQEAIRKFVSELNSIPTTMVSELYENKPENLIELTPPTEDDTVYHHRFGEGRIILVDYGQQNAVVDFYTYGENVVALEELEVERDDFLPMWGYMWMVDNPIDKEWARKNLHLVAQCGFRIYEDQNNDWLFIGIDGAGYDFFEKHWKPLYLARGLKWHEDDTKVVTTIRWHIQDIKAAFEAAGVPPTKENMNRFLKDNLRIFKELCVESGTEILYDLVCNANTDGLFKER